MNEKRKTIYHAWEEPPPPFINPGWVYLIQVEDCSVYKIGRSTNPERRLATLQRGRGYQLVIAAKIWTEYAQQTEQQLHRRFSPYRLDGEWFLLPDEAVDDIRRLGEDAEESDE